MKLISTLVHFLFHSLHVLHVQRHNRSIMFVAHGIHPLFSNHPCSISTLPPNFTQTITKTRKIIAKYSLIPFIFRCPTFMSALSSPHRCLDDLRFQVMSFVCLTSVISQVSVESALGFPWTSTSLRSQAWPLLVHNDLMVYRLLFVSKVKLLLVLGLTKNLGVLVTRFTGEFYSRGDSDD